MAQEEGKNPSQAEGYCRHCFEDCLKVGGREAGKGRVGKKGGKKTREGRIKK